MQEDVGHRFEKVQREPWAGETRFNDADQRTPAGTSVKDGKRLLLASGFAVLLGLFTFYKNKTHAGLHVQFPTLHRNKVLLVFFTGTVWLNSS
jgi:hypothetical protein